jgi:hypothetical protein
VTEFANPGFAIGFFAYGWLDGAVFIDHVEIFGAQEIATTTTTTTTAAPTTTTAPTSTTVPPPTSTTTVPTTTVTPPPTTAPTTTTVAPPPTNPPVTTTTVAPVTSQPPPPTSRPPTTVTPLENDARYTQKAELANHLILANSIMELPTAIEEIPEPSPVTQIMASVTTTAVTVRSHLLSASALGLIIAIAAIWGLGKRESTVIPVREPSSP